MSALNVACITLVTSLGPSPQLQLWQTKGQRNIILFNDFIF